jgi:hypothetical protein
MKGLDINPAVMLWETIEHQQTVRGDGHAIRRLCGAFAIELNAINVQLDISPNLA